MPISDNKLIIIFGNIASGKSTIARALTDQLEGYRYVCLDDTRKKLWKEQPQLGAGQRDLIAQERCLVELQARLPNGQGSLVFETTAVTRFFKKAKAKLMDQGQELTYIYLYCPVEICLRRYKSRLAAGKIQAPFAWGKYSIEQSMYYFDAMQKEVPAGLRINTSKVRPGVAVKIIRDYLKD